MASTTAQDQRRARSGRRLVVVAESLAGLRGPAAGIVELPLRLFWSAADRRFDLGLRHDALAMYEAVLCEARNMEDLDAFLDAGLLARLWPALRLPVPMRLAWESTFPQLRTAAAA